MIRKKYASAFRPAVHGKKAPGHHRGAERGGAHVTVAWHKVTLESRVEVHM